MPGTKRRKRDLSVGLDGRVSRPSAAGSRRQLSEGMGKEVSSRVPESPWREKKNRSKVKRTKRLRVDQEIQAPYGDGGRFSESNRSEAYGRDDRNMFEFPLDIGGELNSECLLTSGDVITGLMF